MSFFDKCVYKVLCLARNRKVLDVVNRVSSIDDFNMIVPHLYLGNVKASLDKKFFEENKIKSVLNCTDSEPFMDGITLENQFRIDVKDSRDKENIKEFKGKIIDGIEFIDKRLSNQEPVFVHCYWGLMRSATVVAGYLIKKYQIPKEEAIDYVQKRRYGSLSSIYNFNDILQHVENTCLPLKIGKKINVVETSKKRVIYEKTIN